MEKRGQLGSIVPIISVIIVVGILIGAGFFILQNFYEQDSFVDNDGAINNESGAYINATGYTLDEADVAGFNSPVIVLATNHSSGGTILSGNYTVSSVGVVTNATTTTWADVNLSYTYKQGGQAYTSVNDTLEALTTIPELLGLIILIAMIGIILAVIFNVIPGSRVGGA